MFSTNLNPADLTDEAFQRRVRFRIPVDDPTVDQFAEVFRAVCKSKNVPFDFESFELAGRYLVEAVQSAVPDGAAARPRESVDRDCEVPGPTAGDGS